MAASRAETPDLKQPIPPPGIRNGGAGVHVGPVLERLQYRSAQGGREMPGSFPASVAASRTAVETQERAVLPIQPESCGGAQTELEDAAENAIKDIEGARLRSMAQELEQRLLEERKHAQEAIAAAREQGRREAQEAMRELLEAEQQQRQIRVGATLASFETERQRYFHRVEGEVVRLALAIAGRVLHRESQLDPMLLTGTVRVALDRLADNSQVVMRVPPAEAERWKGFFREPGACNGRMQPGILEDPSLAAGECRLETELGSIELGIRAQLEEIEKGFFDLLDHRPAQLQTSAG